MAVAGVVKVANYRLFFSAWRTVNSIFMRLTYCAPICRIPAHGPTQISLRKLIYSIKNKH